MKENIRKSRLFHKWMTGNQFNACIIATAAYNSPFAPEVQYLRTVRDEKVRSTEIGNKLMNNFESVYYIFSPRLAYCMIQSKHLKSVIRWTIVRPIVSIIRIISNLFIRK